MSRQTAAFCRNIKKRISRANIILSNVVHINYEAKPRDDEASFRSYHVDMRRFIGIFLREST